MNRASSAPRFEDLNWVATAPSLPRDREPSHRLHQPDSLFGTIDPITGRDVGDLTSHPYLVDGKLTIYFESEATRLAFLNMPLDHPYAHALGDPSALDDRGG